MSAVPAGRPFARDWVPEAWIVAAIVATWALAIGAEVSGGRSWVHHHSIAADPTVRAFVLFTGAWTAMVVAMMLPATIPFSRLFFRTARPQAHPGRARMALLGGYLLVWVAFGVAAVVLDMGVHRGVDAWQWLAARPWLLPGGALLVAGAFQFTDLKAKCLTECRHPAAYLVRHYRRGIGAAFAIGLDHARFCVGCCWALMVLMFAMGVANLVWMAALTALMFAEKALPGGDRLVRPVGYGLLALGALVLLQPDWLPAGLVYAAEAEAAHAHQH